MRRAHKTMRPQTRPLFHIWTSQRARRSRARRVSMCAHPQGWRRFVLGTRHSHTPSHAGENTSSQVCPPTLHQRRPSRSSVRPQPVGQVATSRLGHCELTDAVLLLLSSLFLSLSLSILLLLVPLLPLLPLLLLLLLLLLSSPWQAAN